MVFNSYTFIAFFIIILILHNLPFTWKVKKINLLIASYIFYAAWNPPFILLLWLATIVDYFVGRALYTQPNKHKRKFLISNKKLLTKRICERREKVAEKRNSGIVKK